MRRVRAMGAVVALLSLAAGACGGDDGNGGADGGGTTTTGAGTTTAPGPGAVSSLEDVESAVIRIEAQGTFAEPAGTLTAYQQTTGGWSGSGFIIDPEGIAVTNNHVVTGAATLDVYVEGNVEPVSAQVLGVSECADLAVIDLEGDGYPFLEWYDEEIDAGLEVTAAGFPLGDPEYTLYRGIVSKAQADGETEWASVDHVIEHDANIQPGNSGGPLVTEDGQVVGVNYAGGDPGTGTSQYFAIAADLAAPLVEQLREGDELALGINGVAVVSEEEAIAGIWVSSVDTDSPAGELGLQAGDVIESIEGLPVGTQGTMEEYCDILRSHREGEQLAVTVLRFETNDILQGEFNGDELTAYGPISQGAEDAGVSAGGGSGSYAEFVQVQDDSGTLVMDVPAEWSDVDGRPYVLDDGTEIPDIQAAPDIQSFQQTWETPGVEFLVATGSGFTINDALRAFGFADACTSQGAEPYEDPVFRGKIEFWTECGGTSTVLVVLAAHPAGDRNTLAVLIGQIVSDADFDALDRVLATFNIVG